MSIMTHKQFRDLLERADFPADDPNHLSREVVQALFFGTNWPLVRRLAERLNSSPEKMLQAIETFLDAAAIPTTMTIGDRTYELLSFLREGETSISSETMVARAREMNANLGEEDGHYIMEHQDEIPTELRDKVAFVFPAWQLPDDLPSVAYVIWFGDLWVRCLFWLSTCRIYKRLLRRK